MITDIKKSAEQKMQKSFESLEISFGKIRTGRAHTGILDHVTIDYYGAPVPISQVANVNLADARTINVTPWEKNLLSQIEKTIRDSDLGLNPVTVGEIIRVPMPVLTEERRRDLTKVVKQEAEAARVSMRNIRRDANAHLKNMLKEKKIAEDEERRGQDEVQKLTNHHISEIDKILQAKEVELMAV
jgi:ribosome recycling factor